MARPGPAPVPTKIKQRRGSAIADLNPTEPMPDPTRPIAPNWMCVTSKRVWRELCTQLHVMGVLTKIDRNVLAAYCEMWALWRECMEFVHRNGMAMPVRGESPGMYPDDHEKAGQVIPGPITGMRTFPQAQYVGSYLDKVIKLGELLGLSPSARTRLHARIPYEHKPASPKTGRGGVLGTDRFFKKRTKTGG